ncbi:MAG: gliding motility-associated C-terminal domain-containing protein [Bacteroidetes bacterium]|nr:gliding motility-associated C-terminal domain-containing protein [Bacteroidota bacterium]
MRLKKIIFFFFISLSVKNGSAQCINTFPNIQDFETSATWTSGGVNSDWAWGTPNKGVITGAGGGSKCWIIGGLSGSNYNSGEKSYIESPCYDFSALTSPFVSFKVFWEMEHQYDGASLLYTINNGATWGLVGGFNDPANCMTQNWYNYGNINYLAWSNTGGWSGNSKLTSGSCQGGGGSLNWVTAKHCLSGLAGKQNVKFRFNFGSGTTCNAFDGFAIDDFMIGDAGNNTTSFTYTCSNFSVATPTCTQGLLYHWNFGDQSSASNTSTLSNPTHVFNTPGVYTVSLSTTNGPCNSVGTSTQLVSVIGASVTATSSVSCFGGHNGSATVLPLFGSPAYNYTWYPSGGNNASANSLSAGIYTVAIQDSKGCANSTTVSIQEPAISTGVSTKTLMNCLGDNTLLEVSTSGITDPITYLWSPGSYTTSSISVSPQSNTIYSVNVVVSGNCPISEQKLYTVMVVPKPLVASINSGTKGCAPLCVNFEDKSSSSGTITLTTWSFSDGSITASVNPSMCFNKAGIYTGNHSATNNFGCTSTTNNFVTIEVYPTPVADFETDNKEVSELHPLVNFTDVSSAAPTKWEWNFGGMESSILQNPSYNFTNVGQFPIMLTVSNIYGCSSNVMKIINVLPEFTFYVPNAFTPNGDGLNDIFLPEGMGWDTKTYSLMIFDRWGQKIFHTQDYTKGWDGTVKGEIAPIGEYIYKAQLNDNYKKNHEYTGFITIVK